MRCPRCGGFLRREITIDVCMNCGRHYQHDRWFTRDEMTEQRTLDHSLKPRGFECKQPSAKSWGPALDHEIEIRERFGRKEANRME